MKTGRSVWSTRTLVVTLAAICLVVLGIGAARKEENGPRKQTAIPRIESFSPRVQNETRSFEIIQARRNANSNGGPELSLRNGYDKAITAFAVSVNGLIGAVDLLYSEAQDDRAIVPGSVYTRWFGTLHRSLNSAPAAREELDIKILAVVFDDRSSEGEGRAIAGILYDRNKSKRLLTRIEDLFSEEISSQTVDESLFGVLRSRIASLSNDPGDSMDITSVLRWLDQSDHSLSSRDRTLRVKETCDDLLARL